MRVDEVVGLVQSVAAVDASSGRAEVLAGIVAFSRMAAQLGDRLVEAEINPVFVLPQGQGVRAADGVAVLAG